MRSNELNLLPAKIKTGEMTKKEAINCICSFIINNYPIFGLHKFDEDFREDILVYFLERGEHILNLYNEKTADFFTYLYSNILSYINTKRRTLARAYIKDHLTTVESINTHNETEASYENINYKSFELSQVPYAYNPISAKDLKEIFQPISKDSKDKKLLVLAMKSSFYLSHEQIEKVSNEYNLKVDDMYKTIEYCKNSIETRADNQKLVIERRNYSYYHHKKCEYELLALEGKDSSTELKKRLLQKNEKYKNNMNTLNRKFKKGFLHLRPTNKTIADILGICERQVSYYINCAKKDYEKRESNKNRKKEE